MKNTLLIALLFVTSAVFAQNNVFLDRHFWKTKPGVQQIEQNIKAGNDPAAQNTEGYDAICWAILEGASDITVKHLFRQKGNDINKRTYQERTYLFFAAQAGNIELMKYLTSQGAKMSATDAEGYSIVSAMAEAGQTNTKVYDFCIQNGVNLSSTNKMGANALLLAAKQAKNFDLLDYFIEKGLTLNSTDQDGNNAFLYAAQSGNKALMQQLIEKGINHKATNKEGSNAILFACQSKQVPSLSLFQYLTEQGVEANVSTATGTTPLHLLAKKCTNPEIFTFFIDKGVDANQENQAGETVFMQAAQYNKLPIVQALQAKIKDINRPNQKGESALTLAIRNNTPDVVAFLLEQGADIRMIDYRGNHLGKALMQSYEAKRTKVFAEKLTLLNSKGLDLSQPHENGNTLLHDAVVYNDVDLLKSLQKLSIDVNVKNHNGFTALHIAAQQTKSKKVLDYLLSIGADKSIQTDFDDSVFDLAAENQELKSRKVDINFLK